METASNEIRGSYDPSRCTPPIASMPASHQHTHREWAGPAIARCVPGVPSWPLWMVRLNGIPRSDEEAAAAGVWSPGAPASRGKSSTSTIPRFPSMRVLLDEVCEAGHVGRVEHLRSDCRGAGSPHG